jgi:hypothetical protein
LAYRDPTITSSFSYVFKLADFGTARELGPDETFISLYGTEEYLFPGLYERALVNPGNRTKFSAKVHTCTNERRRGKFGIIPRPSSL